MNNKTLNIGIIVIAIFVIVLIFHWKSNYVRNEIVKHDTEIEKVIGQLVRDNIQNDYPSLVIPNILNDTILVKSIKNDTLITISKLYGDNLIELESKLTDYFISYYNQQDSIHKANSKIPFIIYPNKRNDNGDIIIQPKDIENIKHHIDFLENEVDKAVLDVKEELRKDIDRLNLWTSIWIGILGLFGAILPLYFSHKSQAETKEQFQEIKVELKKQETELKKEHRTDKADLKVSIEKAENEINSAVKSAAEASKNSANAESLIKTVISDAGKQQIKIESVNQSLVELQEELESKTDTIIDLEKNTTAIAEKIEQTTKDSENALANSESAIKSSKELKAIVYLSNSLGNLKQMDFYKIQLYKIKTELYLASTIEKIRIDIQNYFKESDSNTDALFQELIRELIISFRQIRNFLKQREQLKSLEILESSLNELLAKDIVDIQDLRNRINNNFMNLIESLRKKLDE